MSWPRHEAEAVAEVLLLRRGRMAVGDVELLYIPRRDRSHTDMFSTDDLDLCDQQIRILLETGEIRKRKSVKDTFTWGPKNKLAVHSDSGIPVDFFATSKENWWVSLVVRTGSKETNLLLTTGAQKLGRSLNAYGSGVTCSDGTVIPATSEEQVFELCGVPYLQPSER